MCTATYCIAVPQLPSLSCRGIEVVALAAPLPPHHHPGRVQQGRQVATSVQPPESLLGHQAPLLDVGWPTLLQPGND